MKTTTISLNFISDPPIPIGPSKAVNLISWESSKTPASFTSQVIKPTSQNLFGQMLLPKKAMSSQIHQNFILFLFTFNPNIQHQIHLETSSEHTTQFVVLIKIYGKTKIKMIHLQLR